jgi:hypothetical protein
VPKAAPKSSTGPWCDEWNTIVIYIHIYIYTYMYRERWIMQGLCIVFCIGYAWIIDEYYMDYAWIMHRLRMDYAWIMHWLCMDYHGLCIDYA